jgi:hypothetical protein
MTPSTPNSLARLFMLSTRASLRCEAGAGDFAVFFNNSPKQLFNAVPFGSTKSVKYGFQHSFPQQQSRHPIFSDTVTVSSRNSHWTTRNHQPRRILSRNAHTVFHALIQLITKLINFGSETFGVIVEADLVN